MLPGSIIDSEAVVKDQYVGDINDYRKYALLRALSTGGANRIGVCWTLTSSDASADGGKLAYLSQPKKYRQRDPQLFDLLALASAEPGWRRLLTIKASEVLNGAVYFNATLTDNLERFPAE